MNFTTATLSSLTKNGKGEYGIAAPAVTFSNALYTYLRITDINDDGTINFSDLKSIEDPFAKDFLLQPNDIVFARTGASTGRNYFYNGEDGQFVFAGFLIKFSLDSQKVNPLFVKYFCLTKEFRDWIASYSNGSTRGNINAKILGQMPLRLPPRWYQDRAVTILNSIDRKIKENRAINDNLQQQIRAIFQSWFVDFDQSSSFIQNNQFGTIPDDFSVVRIEELPLLVTDYVANGSFADLKANVTLLSAPDYAYFIRNTDLKSGTFGVYVDKKSYDFLSKSVLYGGEIIISNVGDVGSVHLCPVLDKPMTLGNNIILLRTEDRSLSHFLYVWFKWFTGQALIQGIKGGSAQPKFNKTDFRHLPVLLPNKHFLSLFDEVVTPMFETISDNVAENSHLKNLRDSLLPKLMSGEIDVSKVEI